MNTTKIITSLFIFLIFAITFASSSGFCSSSSCRKSEPLIRFPFRLQNHQPTPCGYPGFDILCDEFNQTLIELPNSGKFTVQGIDYATQNIWLNDPENCLPRRLLALNFSGSPFKGHVFQDFTFFNCTFDYTAYNFIPVVCLSGENYSVFASSSQMTITFLQSRCSLIAIVAVPVQWNFFESMVTSDLSDDIQLTWVVPRCKRCESRGGRCGLVYSNSTEIACAAFHGLSTTARYAIIACAAIPAFLFLVGFLCFLYGRIKEHSMRNNAVMDLSVTVAPQPTTSTTTISGLDGQTIESYPKTVLGESLRLPKHDDTICSICLSEYVPKETLRSIPECHHCFHAQCIDEWLQLNASCPVCRNSPSPNHHRITEL